MSAWVKRFAWLVLRSEPAAGAASATRIAKACHVHLGLLSPELGFCIFTDMCSNRPPRPDKAANLF